MPSVTPPPPWDILGLYKTCNPAFLEDLLAGGPYPQGLDGGSSGAGCQSPHLLSHGAAEAQRIQGLHRQV
jgi:hypothetical protein